MRAESYDIYLLVFFTAMCSYLYELILAQVATSLIGGLFDHYVLTFATYILALGLGSLLPISKTKSLRQLILVEFLLTVVGGASIYALQAISNLNYSLSIIKWTHLAFCFLIGILSGYELPLLYQEIENRKYKSDSLTAFVLSVDYLGMFVGSLLFATLLLSFFGSKISSILTAAVNLVLVVFLYFQDRKARFE